MQEKTALALRLPFTAWEWKHNASAPLNNPPAVSILAPGTSSTLSAGSVATFTGFATDPETGDLTSKLVWTSSLDGQIGTGGSFSKALSAGNHLITASVTDPAGKTGQASIAISIVSAPPPAAKTLSVSVVTDKSTYANGNRVNLTVTVTDGVNSVSGAAASLTLVTASGRQVNYNATTDSNVSARFQYKLSTNRDGVGAFKATVAGSKSGYNSASGSANFMVTR